MFLEVFQNYPDCNTYGYGWFLVYVKTPAWRNEVNLSFWTSISRENQDPLLPIMNAAYDST